MNSYLKFFLAVACGTALMVLARLAFSKVDDYSGALTVLAIAPGLVILWRERDKLRRLNLLLIGIGAFGAIVAVVAIAQPKNKEISLVTAVASFFALTVLILFAYAVLIAVAEIIRYIQKAGEEARELKRKQAAIIQTELDGFIARLEGGTVPDETANVTGVVLRPYERCCAYARNVQYVVNKNHTSYVGGSHGVSFRIAKGVRYHVGAYKGHRVTTVDQVVADAGSLYVTDKRIVFAGNSQVVSMALKQIGDVRVFGDGLAIIQENKAQPLMFRFSPRAPLLAAAIRAMVDTHLQIATSS